MNSPKHLSAAVLSGIILVFLATFVAASVHLYSSLPHFDKIFHIVGGAIVAWAAYACFKGDLEHMSPLGAILFLAGMACAVGILWECAERLSSIYAVHDFHTIYHFFHGGDLDDTLGDLLADTAGGLLGGLVTLFKR